MALILIIFPSFPRSHGPPWECILDYQVDPGMGSHAGAWEPEKVSAIRVRVHLISILVETVL